MSTNKILLILLALLSGTSLAYAAKDFNIKNNTQSFLYVNGTSGNVGIGSVTPGQTLDVQGTVRMVGFSLSTAPTSGYVLTADANGNGSWQNVDTLDPWTFDGVSNVYLNETANVGIGVATAFNTLDVNGNEAIGVGYAGTYTGPTNGLIVESNVGIGTYLPSALLEVGAQKVDILSNGNVGVGTLTPNALFQVGTNTLNALSSGNVGIGTFLPSSLFEVGAQKFDILSGGNVGVGTKTPNALFQVGTNTLNALSGGNVGVGTFLPSALLEVGAQKFDVLSAGNVGIGSIAPGQMLDVQGTVRMVGFNLSTTPTSGYVLTADANGNGSWTNVDTLDPWTYDGVSNVYLNETANVGIGVATAFNTLDVSGNEAIGAGYAGVYTGPTNGLIVQSNVGIGTFVPNNSLIVATGNVGIGTAFPGTALDVNGSVRMTGFKLTTGATNNYILTSDANGNGSWVAAPNSSQWTGTSGSPIYYAHNVGIGTSLNANSLDVATNVAIGTTYAGYAIAPTNGLIVQGNVGIGTLNPSQLLEVGARKFDITSAGNVGIGTIIPNNSLIVATGNVGVGTAFPGQSLDVQGTVRMVGFNLSTTPTSGFVLTADANGNGSWQNVDTLDPWTFDGVSNVYLNETANVGIGVSTAFNTLDVNGNEAIGGGYAGTYTGPTNGLIVQSNVGVGTYLPSNLFEVGAQKFDIESGGNVGIGTIAPSATLDVNGGLSFGSIESGAINTSAGDLAGGSVIGSSAAASITSSGNGSVALGWIEGLSQTASMLSNNNGSIAMGAVWGQSGNAASMSSENLGSIAMGFANRGNMTSSNYGSMAMGFVNGGTMTSSNYGSIAMGYADIGNTLQATGQASVAIGYDVQATATDAMALGASFDNNTANSLMVGFTANVPTLYVDGTNVGIGTVTPGGKLTVTGGNVGIGTTLPSQLLEIGNQKVDINSNGNIGIGTVVPNNSLIVATGNVGIGTAFPGTTLDVNGSVRMGGFKLTTSPASGFVLTSDANGNGSWQNVDTLDPWTFDGVSNVYLNETANVGIGVATAFNTLDISGNEAIGAGYAGTDTAPANSLIVQSNVGIGTFVPNNSLIVATGNVGIGSAFPGTALDVNGSVRMTGFKLTTSPTSGYYLTTDANGNGSWAAIIGSQWTGTSGNPIYYAHNVGIGTSLNTNSLDVATNVAIGTTYAGYAVAPANGLIVQGNVGIGTLNPSQLLEVGARKFDITSAGNVGIGTIVPNNSLIVATGNVGIGTAFPGQSLDVQGTVRMAGFNLSTNPTSGYVLTADANGNGSWQNVDTLDPWTFDGVSNVYLNETANVGIGVATAFNTLDVNGNEAIGVGYAGTFTGPTNGLIVESNVGIGTYLPSALLEVGAQKVDILSNGNVGIGTLTPNALFQVGNKTLNALSGGNVGVGTFLPSTLLEIGAQKIDMTSAGNIGIGTIIPNNSLIVATGNVGIGTAFPGTALDVNGSVRMTGFKLTTGATSGYYLTSDTNGNGSWAAVTSGQWTGTSGSPIYYAYNVGIGTSLNTNSLDVATNVAIGTTYAGYAVAPANGLIVQGNVGIGTLSPSQLLEIGARKFDITSAGNVGIGTIIPNNSLIVATGNVGIGTAFPGVSLDVQGTVRAVAFSGGSSSFTGSGTNYFGSNVGIGSINPNNSLIVIGGNVGIGSAFPGTALDVNGEARMTSFNLSTSPTSGYVLTSDANGNGTWQASGSGTVVSGTTDEAAYYPSGTASVSATSDLIFNSTNSYFNQGNVGVGTSLSKNTLDVATNVAIGTTYAGYQAAPANGLVVQGNVGVGTYLPSALLEVGAQKFDVLSGGNVGIGSITPGQLFDVHGTARMTGFVLSTSPTSGYVLTADTNGNGTWQVAPSGSQWTGTAGSPIYYAHNVGIGTSLNTNSLDVATNVAIGTTYAGYQAAPANGLVVQGNVGVGTYLPSALLEVGAQKFDILSGGNVGVGTLTPNALFQVGGNTLSALSGGNVGVGTFLPSALFEVGAQKFDVLSGGNVGIGSITPGQLFDVHGTARMTGFVLSTSPTSGYVLTADTNGNGTWQVASGGSSQWSGTSGNPIYYAHNVGIGTSLNTNSLDVATNVAIGTTYSGYATAPTNGLIVQGNVGIGTLNPSQLLEIGARKFDITSAGNVGIGTIIPNNSLIVATGNVGIGTAFPGVALDVQGTVRAVVFSGGSTQISGSGTNYFSANVGIGTIVPNNSLIVIGGNVGIGSAFPGTALDVNGEARMTSFNLSTSPTSGYVLTSDANGNGTWQASGSGTVVSGTTDEAAYYPSGTASVSATSDLIFNSSNSYFNQGNVGVGTSLSKNTLDVATNVAIGTTYAGYQAAPANGLVVQGNVGVGTYLPSALLEVGAQKFDVLSGGNVGIGSITPGQLFDVHGTARMTGFVLSTSPTSGYVLTADANGNGTWQAASGGSSQWTGTAGSPIYYAHNVGIGTSLNTNSLDVATNVAIGTTYAGYKAAPTNGLIVQGNVGIGTWTTLNALDAAGAEAHGSYAGVYAAPANGLIVSNNVGVGTYLPSALLEVGAQKFDILSGGNVGVGTLTPNALFQVGSNTLNALSGGNVGVGTFLPSTLLEVGAQKVDITSTGNIGIGTIIPNNSLIIATGNVGIGTAFPGVSLDTNGAIRSTASGGIGIGTAAPTGALEIEGGNVGIGTALQGGALISVGGSCKAEEGKVMCFGANTAGVACIGYCSGNVSGAGCTCTCC